MTFLLGGMVYEIAMDIQVSDYEKLGKFYLGREYDLKKGELEDELVLYDSKDLVTHGMVVGMKQKNGSSLCFRTNSSERFAIRSCE